MFSLATILALLRYRDSDDWQKLIIVTVLAVASYYIRTVGLTAIGVVVCTHWLDGRYRKGFILGVIAAVLILPWFISSSAYFDQLSSINPYRTETDPGVNVGEMVDRVSTNLERYGRMFMPYSLVPLKHFIETPGLLIDISAIVIDLLFLYFIVMTLRRSRKEAPLAVYLTLFMIVVLLWPAIWSDTRFVIPIIPLALYAIYWSARDLISRLPLPDDVRAGAPYVIGGLVLLAGASRSAATQIDHPPYNAGWRNYFESAEWIRDNTREDDLVVCRKPFLMNVISGRKTMGYPWIGPKALVDSLDSAGADVVVSDGLFGTTRQYLNRSILSHPESFLRMHSMRESGLVVLEFLGSDDGSLSTVARKREEVERELAETPTDRSRWMKLYEIGTIYHQRKRLSSALEIYERAVTHLSDNATVWHNLGLVYGSEGRYEDSVGAYERAIELNPRNARARLGSAQAYEAAQRYQEAIEQSKAALRLDSKLALAYHTIGRSALALKNHSEAEVALRQALRLEPGSLQIGNDLASLLLQAGKAQEAYDQLRGMVQKNPNVPALGLNLTSALVELDRTEEARTTLIGILRKHSNQVSQGPLRVVTAGVLRKVADRLGVSPESLVDEASQP